MLPTLSLESWIRPKSMADLECPRDSANNRARPTRRNLNLEAAQYLVRVLSSASFFASFPFLKLSYEVQIYDGFLGAGKRAASSKRRGGTVAKIKSQETSFDICPFCSRIVRPDHIQGAFLVSILLSYFLDYKWLNLSAPGSYTHIPL